MLYREVKMKIGYARTSTAHQEAGFLDQIDKLQKYGCEKIYKEQVSSLYHRDEFELMMQTLRPGDEVVVTKLDRLARSMQHFLKIQSELENLQCKLTILSINADFSTPMGKMLLQQMMAFAEFERNIMLERQRVGLEKARAEGKCKGNPMSKEKKAKMDEVIMNMKEGDLTPYTQIAKTIPVSTGTFYKRLKQLRPNFVSPRATKAKIIKERFHGDASAYRMYRLLSRMSAKNREDIEREFDEGLRFK